METDDPLGLVWGEPKRVATRIGERILTVAEITPKFEEAWESQRAELKSRGFSVSQDRRTGRWQVCRWQPLPEAERAERRQTREASRQVTADVDVPRPAGLEYLPFQKAGIAFAAQRPRTLIADEMGLGKTIQAIGAINQWNAGAATPTIRNALIVAPASLKINWQRELQKWLTHPYHVAIAGGRKAPSRLEEVMMSPSDTHGSILIANYDIAAAWHEALCSRNWDLMVSDEAHAMKNPDAQRTRAILGYQPPPARAGRDEAIPPIPCERMLLLTGTPMQNRPVDLWPLIHAADPEKWANFFSFARRYCGAKQVYAGRRMVWDFSGASNLEELQNRLRETIMVRRMKDDVLAELPPKRRQVIELPAGALASAAVTEEMRTWNEAFGRSIALRAAVELAKASDDPAEYERAVTALKEGTTADFQEMSRVRHETSLAKLPYVIDHLEQSLEQGKVICFAHHHDVIEQICSAFPETSVHVTGKDSLPARDAAVQRFQKDASCRLFVGNIRAAGVGLTLTAASHVVFAESDWVPANVNQAEDRAHRIGQKDSVLVQHLVLEGSIDAKMAAALLEKQRIIDQALDKETASALDEPVMPLMHAAASAGTTPEALAREAPTMAAEDVALIHAALRQLERLGGKAKQQEPSAASAAPAVPETPAAPAISPGRSATDHAAQVLQEIAELPAPELELFPAR